VTVQTERLSLDSVLEPATEQGAGTGFVVGADGLIVTNNHVIVGARTIEVSLPDGTTKTAKVVGADPTADLAVLKIDAHGLPTVHLGRSDAVHVGDPVVAIGNALALQGGPTVTEGIVSAVGRTIGTDNGARLHDVLQTDAAINPCNSGGPLLDSAGDVIGINTAIAGQGQNIGFAISIDPAKSVLDDLEHGNVPVHPFLGVQAAAVTPALQRQLGLHIDHGALVVAVTAGSAAENAGIQEGDVILKVGDHDVATPDDLSDALNRAHPGDTVPVVVERGGQRTTVSATIGQRPGSNAGG
jgi:S1-C subfamily serine protease